MKGIVGPRDARRVLLGEGDRLVGRAGTTAFVAKQSP